MEIPNITKETMLKNHYRCIDESLYQYNRCINTHAAKYNVCGNLFKYQVKVCDATNRRDQLGNEINNVQYDRQDWL